MITKITRKKKNNNNNDNKKLSLFHVVNLMLHSTLHTGKLCIVGEPCSFNANSPISSAHKASKLSNFYRMT